MEPKTTQIFIGIYWIVLGVTLFLYMNSKNIFFDFFSIHDTYYVFNLALIFTPLSVIFILVGFLFLYYRNSASNKESIVYTLFLSVIYSIFIPLFYILFLKNSLIFICSNTDTDSIYCYNFHLYILIHLFAFSSFIKLFLSLYKKDKINRRTQDILDQ